MSHHAGRVVVVCSSCELGLEVPTSPASRLREFLRSFFTDHVGCETSIDVSSAGTLRLLPAQQSGDHHSRA